MIELIAAIAVQRGTVVAPPAPPPIKGGTVTCAVRDRAGAVVDLTGELGNWRDDRPGVPTAELKIAAPAESGLSVTVAADMKPGMVDLYAYDYPSKTLTQGMLSVGYGSDGWMMLDRSVAGVRQRYLGFCVTHFGPAPRKIAP